MNRKLKLSMRAFTDNPNHHLWNNRGVWWCHFTVHMPDATAQRMRFSLRTTDLGKARDRRDRILREIAARLDGGVRAAGVRGTMIRPRHGYTISYTYTKL